MFLYLTSTAANTLDKLVPFLPHCPKDMRVAFIPTASNTYDKKPWVDNDRAKLVDLGFQVEDLDIGNKTKKELMERLLGKDIIFVAGGNTFYLLEMSRKSGFEIIVKDLIKKGMIYIGSSAGSVIAGEDIEYVNLLDDPKAAHLETTKGFGLVNFGVLPHANDSQYSRYLPKIIAKYGKRYDLRPLNDNQAILVNGEDIDLIEEK